MSAEIRAWSAPGKLFVTGEYAVLWGGVAHVLAVAPRVAAVCRRNQDLEVELVLPGGQLAGLATPAGVSWRTPVTPAFHFVARTVDLALRAWGAGLGFSIAFEPSPLVDGQKLGLGSSARAAVLAAEAARWALSAPQDALKLALCAHAEAQGGKGSGADVAACFAGGLIRYRRFDVAGPLGASVLGGLGRGLTASDPVDVLRLSAPALPLAYVYTGKSASTPALVKVAEERLDAAARAAVVLESDDAGRLTTEALARADFPAVRAGFERLQALLTRLAGGELDDGLTRVLTLVRTCGGAGKQSGAGGGDGVLVAFPDAETRTAALPTFHARGLFASALEVTAGLRTEPVVPAELAATLG